MSEYYKIFITGIFLGILFEKIAIVILNKINERRHLKKYYHNISYIHDHDIITENKVLIGIRQDSKNEDGTFNIVLTTGCNSDIMLELHDIQYTIDNMENKPVLNYLNMNKEIISLYVIAVIAIIEHKQHDELTAVLTVMER